MELNLMVQTVLECCQRFDSDRSNFQCNDFNFGPQVADGGTYTCKVSNVAGQVDRTFRLTIHGMEAASCVFFSVYSSSVLG